MLLERVTQKTTCYFSGVPLRRVVTVLQRFAIVRRRASHVPEFLSEFPVVFFLRRVCAIAFNVFSDANAQPLQRVTQKTTYCFSGVRLRRGVIVLSHFATVRSVFSCTVKSLSESPPSFFPRSVCAIVSIRFFR